MGSLTISRQQRNESLSMRIDYQKLSNLKDKKKKKGKEKNSKNRKKQMNRNSWT